MLRLEYLSVQIEDVDAAKGCRGEWRISNELQRVDEDTILKRKVKWIELILSGRHGRTLRRRDQMKNVAN